MTISVSEYISQKLTEFDMQHVFMLIGGDAMFLNYAIATNPHIKTVFNHHEQQAGIIGKSTHSCLGGLVGSFDL